jgi:hypothetical protein
MINERDGGKIRWKGSNKEGGKVGERTIEGGLNK